MAMQMFVPSSLSSTSARGIRVVVCEPEEEIRAQLRSCLDTDPVLALVAETHNWSECEFALQDLDPELLIARSDLLPGDWIAGNGQDSAFPVVIALRSTVSTGIGVQGCSFLPMPCG